MNDTRLSAKELQEFFVNAPVVVAMFDRNMQYLAATRRWMELHYPDTPHETLSVSYEAIPWLPPHWKEEHRRVLRGEQAEEGSDERMDVPGNPFLVRRRVQPWRDEAGETGGIIISLDNIREAALSRHFPQERESRYEAMVRMASCAIIHWACDGTILFVNEYAWSLFGYTREQMVGSDVNLIVPAKESGGADLTKLVADIVADPSRFENNINENICRDGSRVWMTWTNRPLRDEQGEVSSILAFGINVTGQVRAEGMFLASKATLHTAFESISDAVCISDREGRFIDFNQAFATFHRFAGKAECAMTFNEYPAFLEVRSGDGAPAPFEDWAVPRALRGETAAAQEYILRRKDTGETWVGSYSFAPLRDRDGNITGSVVVGRDITEEREVRRRLRESEERFRSMVEGAPDPIFIQTDRRFAYLNPAGCRLFGVAAAGDLIGTPILERIHPDSRDLVQERIRRLNIDREAVERAREYRMLRLDGSEVWVDTNAEPIVYQGKHGALVFVRDVGERKAIQNALKQSEERFRSLAESAPVGIVIADRRGDVLFLNEKFTELFGYGIDDIPTVEHWWPLAYPDKQLREKARLSWQLSTEQAAGSAAVSEPSEFPVSCRDGSVRIVEFRKRSSETLNFVVLTDVTQRRNAELAALDRAEDLRITLQSIGDAVITTDLQGRITRMNWVAAYLTGWDGTDATGRSLESIFRISNAKTGAPVASPVEKVLQSGRIVGLANHTVLQAKDGRKYQISDSAAPVKDEKGQMRGVVLVFRDVTESYNLREAIQRERNILQLFVKYAPAAIAMFDNEMRYLSASERYFKDYGLQDRNIIGRSHYDVFPEIPERWREVHRRCLAGAVERCQDDPFPRADGKTDWVRWEIRPWYDDAGDIGGILLFSEVITDFKLTQNALLENEQKTRDALEAGGLGGWDLNLDDFSIHHSELHDRIFGYAGIAPEWNFEIFLKHIHPDDREMIQAGFREAITGEHEWNAECRIRRFDGALRWIWFTGRYRRDSGDGSRHIAGFVQDITDRKKSEERIDHINRVLEAIRQINRLIVYEKDRNTLLQRVCDLLIETRGYRTAWAAVYDDAGGFLLAAESGIGQDFDVLLAELKEGRNPDCLRRVTEGEENIFPIFDTKASCLACPLAIYHHEGAALVGPLRHIDKKFGILVVALPADVAGDEEEQSLFEELVGDLGYALYSLEQEEKRKLAEEHFGLLFKSSTDGILIADIETQRFQFANPAICRFLGYSEEELLSLAIPAIHPEEKLSDVLSGLAGQISGENPLSPDVPCLRRDGAVVYADVNAVFIEIAGRRCLAGFFRDITDRKRAEEESDQLGKQLLQAQKMESIGRLAGGVAHDYNNMLNVIMGYTEMAMETVDRDLPLYNELSEVLAAARRSSDITRQLLAFARKQTILPVVLDLNDAVAGMLKMLQRLIGEDINLSWHPKTGLWLVKIDPAQVDQILANLCVNARDAIRDVGRITIATDNVTLDEDYCLSHPACSPGDYVVLTVGDTGCGMDQETLERIFEPFFTTKEIGKGTGLGMSTVYGIVKQNGGLISIDSEPGKGTAITIYLPRFLSEAKTVTLEKKKEISRGRGETLLLVEDDQLVRKMGQTMLERLGYTVVSAGSPGEAMTAAKLHSDAVRLLITDVVMPEMNGRELADRLRALYPHLKVLFMSGYTADAIAHHGVLDEHVNFIQKPFSHRELAGKVDTILASDRG